MIHSNIEEDHEDWVDLLYDSIEMSYEYYNTMYHDTFKDKYSEAAQKFADWLSAI